MSKVSSSSKIVGKILVAAARPLIEDMARNVDVHRIFIGESLIKNGTPGTGEVSIVYVKEGGIKVLVHDDVAGQEIFLASNQPNFEATLREYLARRGQK